MGADLKLLPRFFVHMGRTEYTEFSYFGGQRYGPRHLGTSSPCSLHDLIGGLIQQLVVICFQSYTDLLISHDNSVLSWLLVF